MILVAGAVPPLFTWTQGSTLYHPLAIAKTSIGGPRLPSPHVGYPSFRGSPILSAPSTRLHARRRVSPDGPFGRGRLPPAYVDSASGGHLLDSWSKRIVALNVVTFLLQQLFPALTPWAVKSDMLIRRGQYYRLFTPVFLHADIMHLMANSYSTLNVGPALEATWGSKTYLLLYAISGVCGNWMSYVSGTAPLALGASTAVSGLMGGLAFWCWRHRNLYRVESLSSQLLQVVMINAFMGATNPRIDNFGHLGGLLGGVACGFLFGPRQVVVTDVYGRRYIDNRPLIQTVVKSVFNRFNPSLPRPPPPPRRRNGPPGRWARDITSRIQNGWSYLLGGGGEKRSSSQGRTSFW